MKSIIVKAHKRKGKPIKKHRRVVRRKSIIKKIKNKILSNRARNNSLARQKISQQFRSEFDIGSTLRGGLDQRSKIDSDLFPFDDEDMSDIQTQSRLQDIISSEEMGKERLNDLASFYLLQQKAMIANKKLKEYEDDE